MQVNYTYNILDGHQSTQQQLHFQLKESSVSMPG